jgi:hypothetical protein
LKNYGVFLVTIAFLLIIVCWLFYQPQPLNWCVIQDVNGDTLRIGVASNETWQRLLDMRASGLRKWVGGKLVNANNEWGFTFDPDTIVVADVTVEALQTTLRLIKQNRDYWFAIGTCYVSAIVLPEPYPV